MGTVDRRCGFGPLKRQGWLQRCANLWCYAFLAGLIVFGVTACYSYMSAVQSTSQTVFSFSSTDIGVWYAMFEVGSVLSNTLASYFLTNKNIPNVLTIGLVMVICGSFMHGLPHFFIDYEDKVKSTENVAADAHIIASLCKESLQSLEGTTQVSNVTEPALVDTSSSLHSFITVIYCIAGFLMGAGYAPFWCLGLVYVDDNVEDVHDTTKYIAVILAFYTIGPVIGFGAGGLFLSYYVTLQDTYLTPDDTQWIGAYWIGYMLFAVFLAILLPAIFCFPKRLPKNVKNSYNINMKKTSTTSASSQNELTSTEYVNQEDGGDSKIEAMEGEENVRDNVRSIKGFIPTLGRLLINPLYMLEVLGSCSGVYYLSGWIGFLPKFFEETFYFSASLSSIYAGALPPLLSSIGVFVGGYLTSRYKLSTQRNALVLFLTTVTSTAVMIPMFFLVCDQYPVQQPPINMTSCASKCGCDESAFVPLCYEQTTYRSPCQVGCDGHEIDGDEIRYTGCFCEKNVTMIDGVCQQKGCVSPYIYIAFAVVSLASFVSCSSAGVNIIMRSVDEQDKSLALGVQSSLNSLLAWIPAPILYGALIDTTCKIWEYPDNPDWQGYCMEYDNKEYRDKYLGMTLGTLALTCIFCGLAVPVSYMERYKQEPKDEEK